MPRRQEEILPHALRQIGVRKENENKIFKDIVSLQESGYQNLITTINTVAFSKEHQTELSEHVLTLSINYLQMNKGNKDSAVFDIFVLGSLNLIKAYQEWLFTMLNNNQDRFVAFVELILKKTDPAILSKVLFLEHPAYLKSETIIKFFNGPAGIDDQNLLIINLLNFFEKELRHNTAEFVLGSVQKESQLFNDIIKTLKSLKVLPEAYKENLISVNGFSLLSNFYRDLDVKKYKLLSRLVEFFITDSDSTVLQWQNFHSFLLSQPQERELLFERIAGLLKVIENNNFNKRFLGNFLIFDNLLLQHELDEQQLKLLADFDNKLHSRVGANIYKRIKNARAKQLTSQDEAMLHFEINEKYVAALNKFVTKPQLELLVDLDSLSEDWCSLEGLTLLDKFSPKFFNASGFKFLANLNIKMLTDDVILQINAADYDDLIRSVNDVSTDSSNTILLTTIRKNRIRQIITLLQANKQEGDAQEQVRKLMVGEDVINLQKFISEDLSEDPILVIERAWSALSSAELLAILNANFCYIKNGKQFAICSRTAAMACIGKPHLFDSSLILKAEDLIDFSLQNFDVTLFQRLLFATKISNQSLSLDKVHFFGELLESLKLGNIPLEYSGSLELLAVLDLAYFKDEKLLAFLTTNKFKITHGLISKLNDRVRDLPQLPDKYLKEGELLLSLDPRYLSNLGMKVVFMKFCEKTFTQAHVQLLNEMAEILLRKVCDVSPSFINQLPQSFFASRLENLELIDIRYLQNSGMMTYLKRFLKTQVDRENLIALNTAASALFNKFSKYDTVSPILENLPEKYFAKEYFTPLQFAFIPERWLKSLNSIGLLTAFSYLLTPNHFKEGMAMAAEKNIVDAIAAFKYIDSQEKFALYFEEDQFLKVLFAHLENPQFEELLRCAVNYLPDLEQFIEKDEDRLSLYRKIYHFIVTNNEFSQVISEQFLNILREKSKISLLPVQKKEDHVDEELSALQDQATTFVEAYQQDLTWYQGEHLTVTAEGTIKAKAFTKKERGDAFVALQGALKNKATAFGKLLATIEVQKKNIGLNDSEHIRKGLQKITNDFLTRANGLIDDGKLFETLNDKIVKDEDNVAIVLLNDFYYCLLAESSPIYLLNLAKSYSSFFKIMEAYRPNELLALLKHEKHGEEFSELHRKYTGRTSKVTPVANGNGKTPLKEIGRTTSRNSRFSVRIPTPSFDFSNTLQPVTDKPSPATARTATLVPSYSMNGGSALLSSSSSLLASATKMVHQTQENSESRYQLQDTDIMTGLASLKREFLNPAPTSNGHGGKAEVEDENIQPRYAFLEEVGLLYANDGSREKSNRSTLEGVKTFLEKANNQGKICYGIFNEGGNHYVSVFAYRPNAAAAPQFIILDPAYNSNEKNKRLAGLRTQLQRFFGNCKITSPLISQQLNNADCGVCCLQNADDLLKDKIVTINSKNEMVLLANGLTLNLEHDRSGFQQKAAEVRGWWENHLSQQNGDQYFNEIQFTDSYNFKANKQLQGIKKAAGNILSQLVSKFESDFWQSKLAQLFATCGSALPKISGVINDFLDSEQKNCSEFYQLVKRAEQICNGHNDELFGFDENSIKEALLENAQLEYRSNRAKLFGEYFVEYLIVEGVLSKETQNNLPENLAKHFENFVARVCADQSSINSPQGSLLSTAQIEFLKVFNQRCGVAWFGKSEGASFYFKECNAEVQKFVKETKKLKPFLPPTRDPGIWKKTENTDFPTKDSGIWKTPSSNLASIPHETQKLPEVNGKSFHPVASTSQSRGIVVETEVNQQRMANGSSTSAAPLPELSNAISNQKPQKVIVEDPKEVSQHSIKQLEDLVANLQSFPKPQGRLTALTSVFFGSTPKLIEQLSKDCNRWISFFKECDDLNAIHKQLWFISSELYRITFNAFDNTTPLPHGNLILAPLAKLMKVSEEDIKRYDTPDVIEQKIRRNDKIESQKRTGHKWLLNAIGSNFMKFKREHKFDGQEPKDLSLVAPVVQPAAI